MPIILAKSAGFCFGVKRAVEMTEERLRQGAKVCLLGELIHNRQVTAELCARGARVVRSPEECLPGEVLIVRAHGIPKKVSQTIGRLGLECCDATCPFVANIHKIVAEQSGQTIVTLIAGDPTHPEVIGIKSYANGPAYVVQSAAALEKLFDQMPELLYSTIIAVSQTTFRAEEWKKSLEILKKLCTNAKIFDTICYATQYRQEEARTLAQSCDAMVIIGDQLSSNTGKLRAVCEELCPSFLIEGQAQILRHAKELSSFRTIGCTAGASTPARTIKEVLSTMSDLTNEAILTEVPEASPAPVEETPAQQAAQQNPAEEAPEATAPEAAAPEAAAPEEEPAAEEAEDFSTELEANLQRMSTDQKVKGIVTAVNPSEIQVDIGRKQTGYVSAAEYSNDPNADPSKELKIGDVLDLIIMKTNDAEGTVQLSKKKFDAGQSWTNILKAEEEGETLEGKVIDVIKGGVLVMTGGVRVFVPASLTGLPRSDNLETLRGQQVRFRVIEINKPRRRAVGSIRAVAQAERKAAERGFWETAEPGKVYAGKVKSLVTYGAFVDIGGLDGMVHISEMSWNRIKHPSEVMNVGDEVEVYIKSLDPEKKKISLGYRKAEDNPWEIMRTQYPVDSVAEVTIVSFTAFGAFAKVIPGVDGLIHISQIADRRVEKPQEELTIGQQVRAKIVGIDFDKKRVSLSIRALLEEEAPVAEPFPEEPEEDEVVASSNSED
ncbi:MAG: bifunctional 4-hydroxy-3-methylbut-2-enyl diphosphate reductase/30S ribosomal protein S1 [Oscillospiraceae bacterium]|jgi:4-hydroxy-3-methylbut-2-enyl diphosphate reductase|nr:bifunctional 4-hydroxy-3-methylbut-2-enyl diphosphate reductase/30S ribosomal protein S1 [Oscillospiraceae bacterium]